MARQSSGTGRAKHTPASPSANRRPADPASAVDDTVDERDTDLDLDLEEDEELVEEDELDEDELEARSAETDALWAEVRVDPIEIALPKGVGYTLRAFRPSTELATPDLGDRDEDFPRDLRDEEEPEEIDEEELTRLALASGRRSRRGTREDVDDEAEELVDDEADEDTDEDELEDAAEVEDEEPEAEEAEAEEAEAEDAEAEDDADVAAETEEVPVFLTQQGRLLLFRSAESLVDFVRSDAEHDLTQLDTWADLEARLRVDDVVPQPQDTYELDLVVENLRGGADAWDYGLLIQAGEVARDIGYALRVESVIGALSSGSPLDALDEGLRNAEDGGIGSFFARRRLRKIRAETAALGWRTIIGKISALTDWRD